MPPPLSGHIDSTVHVAAIQPLIQFSCAVRPPAHSVQQLKPPPGLRVAAVHELRSCQSIQSNSLFQVYATNGPDLTIDMCMAREGIVHSSSPLSFATNCGSDAQSHTKDWWCGSMFTSDSCEFEEEHFNTNWTCRDDICSCGCTNEIQSTGVVEGHCTLLRYDTSVLNVGDTAWTLGSRSKTSLTQADKNLL